MSNQKTTQLRKLNASQIALGDVITVVDVSEVTSPTGENKQVTVSDFATFVAETGFMELAVPYQGLQSANGLAFDESVVPASNNQRCYGNIQPLGNAFSIFVRGYVASDILFTPSSDRVLFGVGQDSTPATSVANSAYIAINNLSLVASVGGVFAIVNNFFVTYTERAFTAGLVKSAAGDLTLYINGVSFASASGAGSIANTVVTMGNGRSGAPNVKTTVYEGHIFNTDLPATTVKNMFYRGVDTTDTSLIASYNSTNLNVGPTQWLDSVGSNHLLLPINGAKATNPSKRFTLSFTSNASGYLGDTSTRDVLPDKYVLTSCLVESPDKPLLSIGSSPTVAPVSASGTGSWRDNRVSFVSASYGVNPLNLLALGAAHQDKTLYVTFSGSASPCTFSFDGYVRN